MIAAVKVESSALDSMRDKLKEIETLRTQLANFSKRILDADQANLNLKTNMLKLQEAYNELKKSKAEVCTQDDTYLHICIFLYRIYKHTYKYKHKYTLVCTYVHMKIYSINDN
jgi:hypothetical protein